MKKWYRYLAAGVLVLLTLCVAGCGGVSHKSPEKVTEELIQSYTDGKEKKVKECYNQADNTEADLDICVISMQQESAVFALHAALAGLVEGSTVASMPVRGS